MNNENNNFNQNNVNNGVVPNSPLGDNNLDNTLNITPDINISEALNNNVAPINNEVLNNNIPSNNINNNAVPINNEVLNNNVPNNNINNNVISNESILPEKNTVNVNQGSMQENNNVVSSNVSPQNSNVTANNNGKKSNIVVFIIVGALILLIIGVLVLVLALKLFTNTTRDTPIVDRTTEYELPSGTSNAITTTTTSSTYSTYSYKGFTFNKQPGYTYTTYSNGGRDYLQVNSSNLVVYLFPLNVEFSIHRTTDLSSQLTAQNMIARNRKVSTYNGIEMVTYEITYNNSSEEFLTVYSSYPSNTFTIGMTIQNSLQKYDYNDLNEAAKILKNSTFNGNISSFSKEMTMN